MKLTTTTTTLFALFLLSALTSSLLPSTTAVPDTDGNPLRNGGLYYILPVFSGWGGGIEYAPAGNLTCPLVVVQSCNELSEGIVPIIISSPYKIGFITEGLPLELSFIVVPHCSPSSKWTIVKSKSERQWSVEIAYHVQDTVEGWFYIKKYGLAHKLTFCSLSNDECADIGVHIDSEGNRRLVLTDKNPLVVRFKSTGASAA